MNKKIDPKILKIKEFSYNYYQRYLVLMPKSRDIKLPIKSASDIYQKMTQHEHVLARPDSYIGSIKPDNVVLWILSSDPELQIIKKEINYVAGLYKIFDEIIVNARDQSVKDDTCNEIRIDIDQNKNQISIWNNGNGIPVELHEKEHIYIPELIFGNLLTSSNYDDNEKRTFGGKNGYGAKLANIYSTHFNVDTVCKKNKKHYNQDFYDNMFTIKKPVIKDSKASPYTRITFSPDLKRFGLDELSDDMVSLFKKRVYDIASSTSKVKVYLNGELVNIKDFTDYIKMFYPADNQPEIIYEDDNFRWKVGVVYDPERGFTQVSSVNGIFTNLGGTHVNHVVEQILDGISKHIQKKFKDVNVKPAYIKDNLTVFIDCIVENPDFASQAKETMTSKVSSFGSKCVLSENFIKKIIKSGIVDEAVKFAALKAEATLSKTDGKKVGSLRGIPKLEDAHWAGGKKAKYTRLILTEGDSAKAFAMHGLSVVGRDKYGVFPLKGKLLNVRDAPINQLLNNAEIEHLKRIIGLKQGVKYTDTSKLRYGGIIILTDQDVDGSHIKGLIINMFHCFWPSLLKINGFIQSMATPIIKVFKASDKDKKDPLHVFYNLTDCKKWTNAQKTLNGLKFKYYKGLGTSKPVEAKEAFEELDRNIITYCWENGDKSKKTIKKSNNELDETEESSIGNTPEQEEDLLSDLNAEASKAIIKAFDKHHANERKTWLGMYNPNLVIENTERNITYNDFVDRELIHFSSYDNVRSIPSICDGFKPSQRKVLFGAYLRNLEKDEVKVAQLAGFVSDKAQYHHGEASLQGTIVGMAQNYVGENNIYLLMPQGEFGTRLLGGKDASSARYIHTRINDITSKIFRKEDDPVLKHVEEDGITAEPITYAPIIPMILVNGATGIGTGYSTEIPKFNPIDIVNNLKCLIAGKPMKDMYPWYYSHKGKMEKLNHNTFRNRGIIESIDHQTVRITELPVGVWTQPYKDFLESLIAEDKTNTNPNQFIKAIKDDSGSNTIDILVTTRDNHLQQLIKTDQLYKKFKLETNINTSNMVLFSSDGKIKKYNKVSEIIEEFYQYRHLIYEERKKHYIDVLNNQMLILKYKVKFIKQKIAGEIVVDKKKREQVLQDLEDKKYPKLSTTMYVTEDKKTYSYIESLGMFATTTEKMEELIDEYNKKKKELEDYTNTPIETMWLRELDEFLLSYDEFLKQRATEFGKNYKTGSKGKKSSSQKKITIKTQQL
jgi:DNA topoisomerase-2